MSKGDQAKLTILDRADKEIIKLPVAVTGHVYDFIHKFRKNPTSRGLNLEKLHGDERLYSARVNLQYRAVLLKIEATHYLLIAVGTHQEYENLGRFKYIINKVTGGLEVISDQLVDLTPVDDSMVGRVIGNSTPSGTEPPVTDPDPQAQPLFARWSDSDLVELGVSELLLPRIRTLYNDEELLALTYDVSTPQITTEILMSLNDGHSAEWVREHITGVIVDPSDPIDPNDFQAALSRPATVVTSDDATLKAVLSDPFERWQAFLHPTQRAIVDKPVYPGPYRVTGGPGTGKTVVALHRVRALAQQLKPGTGKAILLTTYTRNLAGDLAQRLALICEPDELRRVDIVSVDRLANRVVQENRSGRRLELLNDRDAAEEWAAFLSGLPESPRWDADFLYDEWTQVIIGQSVDSRAEYFRVRRVGRGKNLTRRDRDEIWELCQQFTARLAGRMTFEQVVDQAARLEQARAAAVATAENDLDVSQASRPTYRYEHVVVDEAQDMSPAHWRMLRAMVRPCRNDLFLCGDTHQRLYARYVSLKSLGIPVTGRSKRLTLSYRSTGQILRSAAQILSGASFDDLDDGQDNLDGYRSVLNGEPPTGRQAATEADVARSAAAQILQWRDDKEDEAVAVAVPTERHAKQVLQELQEQGIPATVIGRNGTGPGISSTTVQIGTFNRFKGLEFRRLLLCYVSEDNVPDRRIRRYLTKDPQQYTQELIRARSSLFVAATRARDELVFIWSGTPSAFVPAEVVTSATTFATAGA